jgi:hypothetical protein
MEFKKVFKCSDKCNYLIMTNENGQYTENSVCPFDQARIRSNDLPLYHKILSDEEIIFQIEQCIGIYEKAAQPGYLVVPQFGKSIIHKSLSHMKPISFYLLSIIVKSCIHLFLELECLKIPNDINELFSLSQEFTENDLETLRKNKCCILFKDHIQTSISNIKVELADLGCTDSNAWLYAFGAKINKIIDCCKGGCTIEERLLFEMNFEKIFVNKMLKNISSKVIKYKKGIITIEQNQKEKLISEVREKNDKYPIGMQFRVTRCPNKAMVKSLFFNTIPAEKQNNQYKLVKLFLNIEDQIKKIRSLFPLINFSNRMIQKFSHQISRDEANKIQIKQELNNVTEVYFTEFIDAWNKITDNELYYKGHKLTKEVITDESPLSAILLDDKEEGGGMCIAAAISYLSKLQNRIMARITNKKTEGKYPPQKVKKEDILDSSCLDEKKLAKYFINNPNYGAGCEIIFDFDKLQNAILMEVSKKKFISISKLQFIHYQFELINLNESSIINDIRKNIKQEDLSTEKINVYKKFLSNMQKERPLEYSKNLRLIYSSMDNVMLYLKGRKEEKSRFLSTFCQQARSNRLSNYLTENNNPIGSTELKYIISVYNLIEVEYFQYFCNEMLSEKYKNEEQKFAISQFLLRLENEKYPSVIELRDAVMRFLIRYSMANLNLNHYLSYYISRKDLWREDLSYDKILCVEKEIHSRKIVISSSYCFYRLLNELVNRPKDQSNMIENRERKDTSHLGKIEDAKGKKAAKKKGDGKKGKIPKKRKEIDLN